MGALGLGLAAIGLGEVIPAFAVVVGALASVVFTFLKANGTLFGLADFDLVMSLPIPRRTVVASRVAALYASAVLMGAVVALPLWVVYLALVNLSAWTVACCVASILLAPAIPTSIATFLAFGVAAVSSRFRHANLAYVLVALVGFSVLIIGIYGFSFTAGTQTDEQTFAMMSGALSGASDAIAAAWPSRSASCRRLRGIAPRLCRLRGRFGCHTSNRARSDAAQLPYHQQQSRHQGFGQPLGTRPAP